MNVTISGYVSFSCSHCTKLHSIEAQALTFTEDTSLEAEEDEYIRYVSKVDTHCASCGNKMKLGIDTWEYPEAISNYSYYAAVGAYNIGCEFTIEHFFDDTIAKLENAPHVYGEEKEEPNELDEEMDFNETQNVEGYVDQYDDTE